MPTYRLLYVKHKEEKKKKPKKMCLWPLFYIPPSSSHKTRYVTVPTYSTAVTPVTYTYPAVPITYTYPASTTPMHPGGPQPWGWQGAAVMRGGQQPVRYTLL